jgi:hypothetical protein
VCELLAIDEEAARNLAIVYQSYTGTAPGEEGGDAREVGTLDQSKASQISLLVCAATYWLLLDAKQAFVCYKRASLLSAAALRLETALHRETQDVSSLSALSRAAAATVQLSVLTEGPVPIAALRLLNASLDDDPVPDTLALLALVAACRKRVGNKRARTFGQSAGAVRSVWSGAGRRDGRST